MLRAKSLLLLALLLSVCVPVSAKLKWPGKDKQLSSEQLRTQYIQRLQQSMAPQSDGRTLGSLWTPNSGFVNLSSDFKAHTLNDSIVINVTLATSAQQTGTLTTSRAFSTQSGISGLVGDVNTRGVNPLFNANSTTSLKGSGQTAANSALTTSLTGQVIAVLSNGNLVVEAERQILMNREHETMVVRGVVRPNDIATDNSVPSTVLGHLEIELKGKGVISDSTKPVNPLTKAVLWLFGF
jgi:flagellar L-ring protein precursor FlgH